MITDALKAVMAQLKTVPELRYVSEDWGQLDYYDQPPVQFPCALVECEDIRFADNSMNTQGAEATLSISISDLRLFNTSANSPDADTAFDIFELMGKVNKTLHGLKSATFSPLTRTGIARVRRDDAIREFRISYRFAYCDRSAAPVMRKLSDVKPEIDI